MDYTSTNSANLKILRSILRTDYFKLMNSFNNFNNSLHSFLHFHNIFNSQILKQYIKNIIESIPLPAKNILDILTPRLRTKQTKTHKIACFDELRKINTKHDSITNFDNDSIRYMFIFLRMNAEKKTNKKKSASTFAFVKNPVGRSRIN